MLELMGKKLKELIQAIMHMQFLPHKIEAENAESRVREFQNLMPLTGNMFKK